MKRREIAKMLNDIVGKLLFGCGGTGCRGLSKWRSMHVHVVSLPCRCDPKYIGKQVTEVAGLIHGIENQERWEDDGSTSTDGS